MMKETLQVNGYMSGLGNNFETEAIEGALPVGRNSPQRNAHGLYSEQLSGSAFTAVKAINKRTWFYRLRPSVKHFRRFTPWRGHLIRSAPDTSGVMWPGQLRWGPPEFALGEQRTFLSGMSTMTTLGDVNAQSGVAVHMIQASQSMESEYFCNCDGELLIVAQQGRMRVPTEMGVLEIEPGEICVIPRGVIFKVELLDAMARAFICENYGAPFTLPERGPIGANALANPRDFLTPVAAFVNRDEQSRLYMKWGGELYHCDIDHSPFDVVAWHGNFVPYKYDLRRFCPVGAVSFDHPDPSIYTVLTSQSGLPGVGDVDFVIFPERWMVAEDTFRPPWYHRNIMSEFMGLIYGVYDAKPTGFVPGGMSLHNMMIPHGPDVEAYERATTHELRPQKLEGTLAFMFETRLAQRITKFASELSTLQPEYPDCWNGLRHHFPGPPPGGGQS